MSVIRRKGHAPNGLGVSLEPAQLLAAVHVSQLHHPVAAAVNGYRNTLAPPLLEPSGGLGDRTEDMPRLRPKSAGYRQGAR